MRTWIWLAAALSAAVLVAAACTGEGGGSGGAPAQGSSIGATQRDGGEGGVTVQLTWLATADLTGDGRLAGAAAPHDAESHLLLRVRMDTHSGDLTSYDMLAGSEMLVDGGPPLAPVAWHPLSDDSHHLEALLVFERPEGASSVEVALKDLSGVPRRVFRWAPPPGL